MLRKLIATALLPAAAAGAVALINQSTASAAPARCTAQSATKAVTESRMCQASPVLAADSSESQSTEPMPTGPESLAVYDPDHLLDGPHYGDHTYIDNPNVP